MKTLFAFLTLVPISGSAAAAQAQIEDWRSCAVKICSNGECDGPNSNLIVVAPANFADPGFGGEAAMMPQLEALSERLYPAAQGWTRTMQCTRALDKDRAMKEGKAFIALAQLPPATHEIKIASPFDVWKYSETADASGGSPVTKANAGTPAPDEAKQRLANEQSQAGPGDPMNFIMWIGLREPINGENGMCFHAIKTRPAPEGYRGKWPTLENAFPIIRSYFPAMREQCRKHGTLASDNVGFQTDDASPAESRANMQSRVERWRRNGNPEVYISN